MSDKKTRAVSAMAPAIGTCASQATPDLRAGPGDPASTATGAIRGMINMMERLRKDIPAEYAACVFDAKGPDRKSTRLNSSHVSESRMPSSA